MNKPTVHLLRLHEADNVLTVIASLEPNEVLTLNGHSRQITQRLPIGHKVASRFIAAGEKILKYGVPIGSAVVDIAEGDHVHTHNIKSDYLPTFERESQQLFFSEHP